MIAASLLVIGLLVSLAEAFWILPTHILALRLQPSQRRTRA